MLRDFLSGQIDEHTPQRYDLLSKVIYSLVLYNIPTAYKHLHNLVKNPKNTDKRLIQPMELALKNYKKYNKVE